MAVVVARDATHAGLIITVGVMETSITCANPELIVWLIGTDAIVVAILALRRAPVHDVLTLGAIVTRMTTCALPEHVVIVVGACAVAGAIFVFRRTPVNE